MVENTTIVSNDVVTRYIISYYICIYPFIQISIHFSVHTNAYLNVTQYTKSSRYSHGEMNLDENLIPKVFKHFSKRIINKCIVCCINWLCIVENKYSENSL